MRRGQTAKYTTGENEDMKQCIGGVTAFLIVLAGVQAEPTAFLFERADWPSVSQGEMIWLTMTGARVDGLDGRETDSLIRSAVRAGDDVYLQVEGASPDEDASRMTNLRLFLSSDEAGEDALAPWGRGRDDAVGSAGWDADELHAAVREANGVAPVQSRRYGEFQLTVAPHAVAFEEGAQSIETLRLVAHVAEARPEYLPVYGADAEAMEVEERAYAKIEAGSSPQEALQTLADTLSATVFGRAPIQVAGWVTEDDGAEYAVIDLREPEHGRGWAELYFQGSTGGSMTTYSLQRTLSQCVGPEPHGLIFHYEGEPIEPHDWDHIGLHERVTPGAMSNRE